MPEVLSPRSRALSRRLRFSLLLAGLAGLASPIVAAAHDFKAGPLEIRHPWSRATPPGAKVAGGYLVVRNGGSEPDRLVGASAEIAGQAEMHEMSVQEGVMKMRPVAGGLEVPARGELALEPGAYHLMLRDLKRPLKAGESFDGVLTFEKAGEVKVSFKVEALGGSPAAPDPAKHAH
jgi:periplasmic copper chaperone A